jgi:FAD/FMN-containing dehydrogenase
MAEGGLVIDVSRLKRITVDLETRTATAETGPT